MTTPHEPSAPPSVPPPPPPPPSGRPADRGPDPDAGDLEVAGPATARPDDVPDLDDRDRELDRRVVTVWRVSAALGLGLPSLVASVVAIAAAGPRWGLPVAVVLAAAVTAFVVWYPRARYDRWRWRLTDLAIELEHGVVIRQAEALPYFRIQQIDVNQGPIDRLLGLASLQVTSASASGSVALPGISADNAPGVRRALLARAAAAVGEQDAGVRDAV